MADLSKAKISMTIASTIVIDFEKLNQFKVLKAKKYIYPTLHVFDDIVLNKRENKGRETCFLVLNKNGVNKYYNKIKKGLKNHYDSADNNQPMKCYFNSFFGSPRICYNSKVINSTNS